MLVVLGYEQLFNFRLLGEKTPSLPSGLEWWDKEHLTRPKSDRFLQTLCNCKRMEHEHQACCNFYIVAFHQNCWLSQDENFSQLNPLSIPVVLRSFSTIHRFGPPQGFRTFWHGPRLEQLPPHPNLVQWRAEFTPRKNGTNFWIWVFPKPVVPPSHPF